VLREGFVSLGETEAIMPENFLWRFITAVGAVGVLLLFSEVADQSFTHAALILIIVVLLHLLYESAEG